MKTLDKNWFYEVLAVIALIGWAITGRDVPSVFLALVVVGSLRAWNSK